jgi:PAS domain S-box-containing protein
MPYRRSDRRRGYDQLRLVGSGSGQNDFSPLPSPPADLALGIIDGLASSVALLDQSGSILMVNSVWRAFARANDGSPETCEGVGLNYFDVCTRALPDPVVQRVLDGMRDVADRRRPEFNLEYPCHSSDQQRWMLMTVTPLEAGQHRLMVAHREVTTRVEAVEGRRQSDVRFKRLFDSAPLAMSFFRRDGRVVAQNRRCERLFGYSLADVPTLDDLWRVAFPDPDYRACSMAAWESAVKTAAETGTRIEANDYRVTCKDGTQRIVQIFGIAVADGVVATFLDVTERRSAEARLRLWAEAFEHANLGLAISDARTNRFLAVNPTFARQRGYLQDELVGKPVILIFPEDLRLELRARIARIDEPTHDAFETEQLCKDGRRFPVLLDITVLRGEDGRPMNRIAFAFDLTERKRTEDALRALNVEMERLTHRHVARQTIAAIAHELNQPLNAIATYSEAALRLLRAGNPHPERLQLAVESGAKEVQRAGQAARQLLSVLKTGDEPLEAVDISSAVRAAMKRLRSDRPDAPRISLEAESGLLPVRANRLQVEKVLANLIENGIEVMRDAGVLEPAISISIHSLLKRNVVQVTVRDHGPGVEAPLRNQIFKPFFTTKPGGLGMGLAISRNIVESHGGELWFDSEPGAGARFHLTLPFAE